MADPDDSPTPDDATNGAPILDLSTLVERPKILIDGELHEIASPGELSILDHHRLRAWGRRHDALMARDKLAKAEERELAILTRRMSDLIMLGVPAAVRGKLSDSHRLQVIEVFTELPRRRAVESALAAAVRELMAQSTGANRPPASNGSSAASPAGGSATAPSPSSGPT